MFRVWLERLGLVAPKEPPTQAELSMKAFKNKPPPTFGQKITHTIGKRKVSRAVKKENRHVLQS